jgi:uncharacterized membrane protein
MTGRAKIWRLVVAVFAIVNAAGAVFALFAGEWMHAGVHVALLALTVFVVGLSRMRPLAAEPSMETLGEERLAQLQQSVDAIAVEVERIGEAQRFNTKLAAEQIEKSGQRLP